MKIKRASAEIEALIAKVLADIDALKEKSAGSDMPEEDVKALEDLAASLEGLNKEKKQVAAEDKIEVARMVANEPRRPLPATPRASPYAGTRPVSAGEGFGLWLGATGPDAELTQETHNRARTAGFNLSSSAAKVKVDLGTLNRKARAVQRTILSKGGAGTGAEYVWQGYSDKVVEYLTYFSPILGLVDSETTSDGNKRTYFIVDDTAMESAYITASSGTETNPTIPAANLVTANKVISTFDITSGVQQVSFQELRDSYVKLEDKVAKANSNSHARKLEREIFTAAGNGSTGVEGIMQAGTAATPVAAWTQDALLDLLTSIPAQYRKDAVFASDDATRNAVNVALRDDIERSLFDRSIEDDQEFDTLFGHKWIVSEYITDDYVLCFVPGFYKLRLVSEQLFQRFDERYWPMIGWAGMMSFGGAWVGPATANKKLTLE